ncbi:alkaline phosphatase family protein [Shimazuella soli]|uniref:alkaline phosphatase family protein n=1 Tax=Shimazuella soli TaxID=1892854 RepID=UPI001F10CDE0|nr:alkaline phosphatase family protein [Shimazuella soli]
MLIDSLMDTPLQEEIQAGRAPTLQFLRDNGTYFPRVVSSFPTMSVSIDTTMLTGEPPNKHGIYGLTYYHSQQKKVFNFGTGPKEILFFGLKRVLHAAIMQLNQKLISKDVETIHEATEKPTAAINSMIYRGNQPATLKTPWLAWLFGLLPRNVETSVPSHFSFGSLFNITKKSLPKTFLSKFGMNDHFSSMEIISLIEEDKLPPLSLVYFPGNDTVVHKKGTSEGKGIKKVDEEISPILNAFGSWEEAIQKCNFIVLGDSGQTNMMKKDTYVDLRKILRPYSIMPLSRDTPKPQDQLIICVNERMSYITILDDNISYQDIVRLCKAEKKIDVIAWQTEDRWIHVVSGQTDGALSFRPDGDYTDEYNQKWQLEGDISILDLTLDDHQIQYGLYPDALSRLAGAMDPASRNIIITISPGYELVGKASPKHKGASHGSLHHLDSLVPMIVTGMDNQPEHLRLIDLKKWFLNLLQE